MMKTFEIQTPDGRVFEVEAPDAAAAAQAAESFGRADPVQSQSATREDFLAGTGAFADRGGQAPAPVTPTAPLPQRLSRSAQIAAQSIGSGVAGVLGAPADIAGGVVDLGLTGAEAGINLFRDDPITLPRVGAMPLGHEHLTSSAGEIMSALGFDPIERTDMAPHERMTYDAGRFASEGATAGVGLSQLARQRFPSGTMQGQTTRTGDAFLRPYVARGPVAVVGDTAAGAGAGVGYNLAEEYFPESELGQAIGMLAGGLGGVAIAESPAALARGGRNVLERMVSDPNVPMDASGAPVSKRVARRAGEMVQQMAEDPQQAAETIARRTNEAGSGPVATSGLLSGDVGLISSEQAVRTRDRAPFIQRDQQVARRASDNVSSLRDPAADVDAAQRSAQARPAELADVRDADALPLLQRAEQSGATVDAKPVADLIDSMLKQAKRPAVRTALTEARRTLNRVGTDHLDTSVSGLYETRKAINDIIEGRTDTPTGNYAKKELIEVRDALDKQINDAAPEFGEYLKRYREGSAPINELRDSAHVAKLMEQKPQDVAHSLLSGRSYASPERMREITKAIQHNPAAMRGWRAAVADVLSDKVRTTGGDLAREGAEGPLSIAKMRQVFGQNRDALAEVFSPDDIKTLERAHELLSPMENRRLQATSGSPTAENAMLTGAWDALGTAMTFRYGAVHAGMIMYRLRRMVNHLPGLRNHTLDNQALELVNRMWFDPELSRHLLEADVSTIDGPGWNKKLNRMLAGSEYLKADPGAAEPETEQGPEEEFMDLLGGR